MPPRDTAIPAPLQEKNEDEHQHSPFSPDIPDGGLVAWLQVVGSFMVFFNAWGFANSFGVFQSYYESAWPDVSSSDIAWIGAIQSFFLSALSVLTGPLYDKGYYLHLEIAGAIFLIVGIMTTSVCTTYWQAVLAQGLCLGTGSGLLYLPSVSIPAGYFAKKRPLAIGMATIGSSVGAISYSIAFHRLAPRIGFPGATRVLGYISIGTLVIALALLRPRVKVAPQRNWHELGAFREPPFTLYSASVFTMFMGMYIPFFFITSYSIDKHIADSNLSFYLIAILNAGSIFGRLLPNYLANHVGTINVVIPAVLLSMIMTFVWIGITSLAGIIVFAIIYGFASGAYVSLQTAAVARLTKDIRLLGGRLGMVFFCGGVGALIGNPIAGTLLGHGSHTYWKAQVFAGCMIVAAAICVGLCRHALVGFRPCRV